MCSDSLCGKLSIISSTLNGSMKFFFFFFFFEKRERGPRKESPIVIELMTEVKEIKAYRGT